MEKLTRITFPIVLVLVAVWIASHPFRGLHHDGVLYAAQALLHLEPGRVRGDVFFAFGSQDDYTLFGRMYAAFVSVLGVVWGPRVVFALSHTLAFVTALYWLARALPAREFLFAAAIAIAAPVWYGSSSVFKVAEPFVTARLLSEPMVLLALFACLQLNRPALAGGLLASAALLHPLVALPGALACTGFLLLRLSPRLRCRLLALAFVIGLMLTASVVAGVWPRLNDRWYDLQIDLGAIALPGAWKLADWVRQLFPPLALALISQREVGTWRLLWQVLAGVAVMGTVLAGFAEISRWELGLQAQFWRFAWLTAWALPLAAVRSVFGAPAGAFAWRSLMLAIVPALALGAQGWWVAGWLLPLVVLVALAVHSLTGFPEVRMARWLAVAVLIVLAGFAVVGGAAVLLAVLVLTDSEQARRMSVVATLVDYLGWVLCPIGVWAVLRLCKVRRYRPAAKAAVMVILALALFADGRATAERALDRMIVIGAPWRSDIPATATVFWPGRMTYVWFGLRRNSYLSIAQVPGILFSESKTVELARRFREVGPVGRAEHDGVGKKDSEQTRAQITRADLARACADPILDYVVLDVALAPVVGDPWIEPDTGHHFHLHRCADHRASVTPVLGPVAPPG